MRNLVRSLFVSGRVTTTLTKAKAARSKAERLVTLAREDTVHHRRLARAFLPDTSVVTKLFTTIAPVYNGISGGYTRIWRLGPRRGDGAELAILELVPAKEVKKPTKKKRPKADRKATAPEEKLPPPEAEASQEPQKETEQQSAKPEPEKADSGPVEEGEKGEEPEGEKK